METCTKVDDVLRKQVGVETDGFVSQLLPQLMDLVRACKRLPVGEEHAIRRGSRDFLDASKELGGRSLGTVQRVLQFLDVAGHQTTTAEELGNFRMITDCVDNILEKVDTNLRDALAGPSSEKDPDGTSTPAWSSAKEPKSRIARPQVRWRQLVDNDRTSFVPRILEKHNRTTPLPAEIVEAQCLAGFRSRDGASGSSLCGPRAQLAVTETNPLQSHLKALGISREAPRSVLPNPYEPELQALTWDDVYFQVRPSELYPKMDDTPLVVVRTEEELRQMIEEILSTCIGKEIAVDVEHHDFRSYRGFVCLVQISTRNKDFIVDPFDIFEQMHLLNEVFTDPRIVKVLHGSDRDVMWLQRDFSIYIVNMFDTGQATRVLRFQGGFSLANLVQRLCDIKLDKKYQTSDWRERPLPEEMLQYARCDTHYLLYCYDRLRNSLLGTTGGGNCVIAAGDGDFQATDEGVRALQTVMDKSRDLCRFVYEESALDGANVAMRLCERFGSKQRPLESRQFDVLQSLVGWRDRLARNLDESWNYIAPDACLWRISLAMPSNTARLRSTCNPLPPTLQGRAQEIVDIIIATSSSQDSGVGIGASESTSGKISADRGGLGINDPVASPMPAAAASELSAAEQSAAPAAPVAKVPRIDWPTRTSTTLTPVVHVTVESANHDVGAQLSGGLRAVLCSNCDLESDQDHRSTQLNLAKVEEILGTMRFAAEAPAFTPSAVVEEDEVSTHVQAEDGTEENAVMQMLEVEIANSGAVGAFLEETGTQEVAPSAGLKKLSRKKRKRAGASLEQLAKAVTDPYAELTLGSNGPIGGARKKGKKRRLASGQAQASAVNDPYLF